MFFNPDGHFGQWLRLRKTSVSTTKSVSTITINGQTYTGRSVSIINGEVTIDGVKQSGDKLQGVVKIEVNNGLAGLTTDAPVVVNGDVHGDVHADGPVTCGDVAGNVEADGPVTCGNVTGDVTADGPCTCGNVGGDVEADMVVRG